MEVLLQSTAVFKVLQFLPAKSLTELCVTCISLWECCQNEFLWKDAFNREVLNKTEPSREDWIENLVNRPFGRDAVGWEVDVEDEMTGDLRRGRIEDTQRNFFLAQYEGQETPVWEFEGRAHGPWHTCGRSRFSWLAGPGNKSLQAENGQDNTVTQQLNPNWKERQDELERQCKLGTLLGELTDKPLEGTTWQNEFKSAVANIPKVLVGQLKDNTDEVLDLAFSHNGEFLATCSRDKQIIIYEVPSPAEFQKITTIHSRGTPCRVLWSPNDMYLLVTIEEPHGNGFGSASFAELWSLREVVRNAYDSDEPGNAFQIGSYACTPFDIHACWLPDGRFISGDSVKRDSSQEHRNPHREHAKPLFTQCLVIWAEDIDDFGQEEWTKSWTLRLLFDCYNYAHLFQVSTRKDLPCWGAFLTGTNPFLGHQIKILPLADFHHTNHQEFEVKVEELSGFECEGAVCSLRISDNGKLVFVNVRPFVDDSYQTFQDMDFVQACQHECPDIANQMVLQIWDCATRACIVRLEGHHAFTTKLCPFMIFAQQSRFENNYDYIASGSEGKQVFVWHIRHRRLVQVLKGHTDVVSAVSWSSKFPGLLVSASDDMTVCLWGPEGMIRST